MAGVVVGEAARAYPVDDIRSAGTIKDEFGGTKLTIQYDSSVDSVTFTDGSDKVIDPVVVYWFVWKGIHPDSGLHRPE